MNITINFTTDTVYNINGKQWSLSTIRDKLTAIVGAGNSTTHRIGHELVVTECNFITAMLVSYDITYRETTKDMQAIGAVVLNATNQIDQDMAALFRQAVIKYEQITGHAVPGYSSSAPAILVVEQERVRIVRTGPRNNVVVADRQPDIFESRNVHPTGTRGGYVGATRGGRASHIDSRDNRNVDNHVRTPPPASHRGGGSHYYDNN